MKYDFDLDQAIEDFHFMCNWYGDYPIKYEYYMVCAIQAQLDYFERDSRFQDALRRLKLALGGYQLEMELD